MNHLAKYVRNMLLFSLTASGSVEDCLSALESNVQILVTDDAPWKKFYSLHCVSVDRDARVFQISIATSAPFNFWGAEMIGELHSVSSMTVISGRTRILNWQYGFLVLIAVFFPLLLLTILTDPWHPGIPVWIILLLFMAFQLLFQTRRLRKFLIDILKQSLRASGVTVTN